MKRYYTDNIVFGPVADDEEVHFVYRGSDLHAWALKHKATLHEIDTSPWDDCGCEVCQRSLASHADALREIEELL